MNTYSNILKPVKQYALIGIIVFITLCSLTFKANAQSPLLGNDIEKINSAMIVQLANADHDIIIPKVKSEELETLKGSVFNQLVYVSGKNSGYYFFTGSTWEKQNVSEVFELIDTNMTIQEPEMESLIIMAGEEDSPSLLEYNHHVKNIYHNFVFNGKDNTMAILLEKE